MILVVMPAFNEAEGIRGFIEEIATAANVEGLKMGFLIQDDKSTDETASVCKDLGNHGPWMVDVETNSFNRGHGPTSRRLLERASLENVDWVLHVDGDGQFKGRDLIDLVRAAISENVSIIGSRQSRNDPWFRKVLTLVLKLYVSVLTRKWVNIDLNSPVRVHPRSDLSELLTMIPTDSLVPSVWCNYLVFKNYPYRSIPLCTYERRGLNSVGTMWSRGKPRRVLRLLPSRRLIRFSVIAALELIQLSTMKPGRTSRN